MEALLPAFLGDLDLLRVFLEVFSFFFRGDFDGVRPEVLAGVFLEGVLPRYLAGVFVADLAGDFDGVLPRDLAGDLALGDALADVFLANFTGDLAGVFNFLLSDFEGDLAADLTGDLAGVFMASEEEVLAFVGVIVLDFFEVLSPRF